jgi:hypothetical protein
LPLLPGHVGLATTTLTIWHYPCTSATGSVVTAGSTTAR